MNVGLNCERGGRQYGHAPVSQRCIEFERYTQTVHVTV